jgi:hypothetical protein
MKNLILCALLIMPLPLFAAAMFTGSIGPFWMITISRIDIEGYPVYTVWKNFVPYATASSRGMAESYTKTEAQHRQEMKATWDRGWEIARMSHGINLDGTDNFYWRVWYRDGQTAKEKYFNKETDAKTFADGLNN